MNLLFSGHFPAWIVCLILVILVGLTLWGQRGRPAPGVWKYLLPGLRIGVYMLVMAALLQPVISRQWDHTVRGKIAVILDDSGSMGITDTYSPAQKVKTAWKLGLFPKDIRCSAFEAAAREADDIRDEITALMSGMEKVLLLLDQKDPGTRGIPQRLRRQVEGIDNLVADIGGLQGELREAVNATGYLSETGGGGRLAGKVLYERFDDIDGRDLERLIQAEKYPYEPDYSAMLETVEMPADVGDRYGARMRAVLTPPTSGKYQFFISADDRAAVYFSEDKKGGNRRRIAFVKDWVKNRDIGRYPEQQSATLTLAEGRRYYLEALLKEQVGDDHCTVGWKRPDGRVEMPIPGIYFSVVPGILEQAAFKKELNALLTDLAADLKKMRLLGATVTQTTRQPVDRLKEPLTQILRQSIMPQKKAWTGVKSKLNHLQNSSDAVLAMTGGEGVRVALNKLSKMTRFDLGVHLLEKGALKMSKLNQLGDVDLFLLNEPPRTVTLENLKNRRVTSARDTTRLGSVAYDILMFYGSQPVSAVVVLTDGNNNAGRALNETSQVYLERHVPLLGVGIGLEEPPNDISVASVSAPATSFKGDFLVFNTLIRRHGYTHRPIRLTVSSGNDVVHEQTVPPGDTDVVSVDVSFVERRDGFRHYVVEAEPMSGEVLLSNNRKSVSVNVLTDPIRALVVDEFPRWETRYAKMMLEKDSRVEARTVFTGNAGLDQKEAVPEELFSRENLFTYDIIVLGDVPKRALPAKTLANMRAFVVEKGGCLVLLAGPNHMPRSYRQSAIEDVFPFKVVPKPAVSTPLSPPPSAFPELTLTESGKLAPPVRLSASSKGNAIVWKRLPPVNWLAEGVHPAANADVLVKVTADGRPAVLMSQAGLGRVLFLGTDSFWRWRRRTGWRFHHRLWGQIFLWATVGRTTGMDEHVKLMTEKAEYSLGEVVVLKARVLGLDKRPLASGNVTADIVNSDGETVKRVRFTYLKNSGGEYRAQARDLPMGEYTVVPRVRELAGVDLSANYPFEIKNVPTSEYVKLALNTSALSVLTKESYHFLDAGKVLKKIPDVSVSETRRQDVEIWDTGWFLLLVTALLGAEWYIRKKLNLV